MSKIKVAVIGCGTIANAAHIPSYMKIQDKVEIKYFCDIIPERAEKAVKDYGCGTAITDYHVALNDPEVQAVSVCTPNYMHCQISCDAMRAGKDVEIISMARVINEEEHERDAQLAQKKKKAQKKAEARAAAAKAAIKSGKAAEKEDDSDDEPEEKDNGSEQTEMVINVYDPDADE